MDHKPAPFVPPAPVPRTQPPSMLQMMRIVYRNPLELWGEPSYNEPYISVTGVGGPLVIANDPALIRHVLVDNVEELPHGDGAPDGAAPHPARRPADRRGRRLEALAQGHGADLHAAPHFRLCRARCWSAREAFAERYEEGGVHDIARRHDQPHLRHPGRDAVFRRDRRRAGQLRRPDRPPVRDHGPRRSARPAARAGMAAAPHPHPRPQDHGLFPQHRRRHDRHAQRQAEAFARRPSRRISSRCCCRPRGRRA